MQVDATDNGRSLSRRLISGVRNSTALILAVTQSHEHAIILAACACRRIVIRSAQERRRAAIESYALDANLAVRTILEEAGKGRLTKQLLRTDTTDRGTAEIRRTAGGTRGDIRPLWCWRAHHFLVAAYECTNATIYTVTTNVYHQSMRRCSLSFGSVLYANVHTPAAIGAV